MIRLGHGKPKIQFNKAHNDMSHFHNGYWEPNYYFYVTDEMYLKFLHFTDATLKNPPEEELDGAIGKSLQELMGTSFAQRMSRALELNPDKSQFWQFNALTPDLKSFIRSYVVLGEPSLTLWSVLDAFVVLPILNMVCNLLNRARYFQNKKEWAAWEKFYNQAHKEKGA